MSVGKPAVQQIIQIQNRPLHPAEIAHLAVSGQVITFEIGIRFLTDFLAGDTYFKTKRPGHNLDRAANQFAIVRSLETQRAEMEGIVRRLAGKS